MSDKVAPQTFEEAFGGAETRNLSLEATTLTRHPELQVEEEQFVNAREAEAQDDFSRGIACERSGSGDGTVTHRTPNANNIRGGKLFPGTSESQSNRASAILKLVLKEQEHEVL